MTLMKNVKELFNGLDGEIYMERLVGNIDVERLDGTVERDVPMYRKEKIADPDDTESVYEREYVAIKKGDIDEEIFLGNDKGETITIKEKGVKKMNAKRDLLNLCQYILDQWEIDTRNLQDKAEKIIKKYESQRSK